MNNPLTKSMHFKFPFYKKKKSHLPFTSNLTPTFTLSNKYSAYKTLLLLSILCITTKINVRIILNNPNMTLE